jgi:type IV pilus assembly protein PilB
VARASFNELLIAQGQVTPERLNEVLKSRADTAEPVDELLVRLGVISASDRIRTLSTLYQTPIVDLNKTPPDPAVAQLVSHRMAARLHMIPFNRRDNVLMVAMVNPIDVTAIDEIAEETGLEVEPYMASEEDINEATLGVFGNLDDVSEIIGQAVKSADVAEIKVVEEEREAEFSLTELREMVEGAPVVRLVNVIISRAVTSRASDIHIEPESDRVRVRFRVDGLLQEAMSVPKDLQQSLISRIKVMANMDIAERRVPQDGRLTLITRPNEYDLRISTYPSLHGENVVMRILDKNATRIELSSLGLRPQEQAIFEDAIYRPYGMILSCGPTGCGKTTTLYAVLNVLNSVEKNILTIEDPVEYQLRGVIQANVNKRAGMTFANGLRAIVRQDPDVVMVGEIRDEETAEIAVEAALTGHLVLSTLHTNDAAGAVSRLVDMGIEPFLVASALLCVAGQRLVRTICPRCKTPVPATQDMADEVGISMEEASALTFYRGSGCDACTRTGYRGRVGIFETMRATDELRHLMVAKASAAAIRECAIGQGMRTMREAAVDKIKQGITTVEEMLRVTQQ